MLKCSYFMARKENNKKKSEKNNNFSLKISCKCGIINVAFKCCHSKIYKIVVFGVSPKRVGAVCTEEREKEMRYLAIEVAKHLIQLYYRSDKEYHCTLTKVEKLLAIAGLVYAKSQKRLFLEEITIKNCGVGIDGLEFDLPSEIIDTRSALDRSETGETDTPICPIYQPVDCVPNYFRSNPDVILSEDCKELLLSIFEQFANYKARTLGALFDGFKHHISYIADEKNQKRCIDQDKVKEFFERELGSSFNQNQIYNFIKNYKDL